MNDKDVELLNKIYGICEQTLNLKPDEFDRASFSSFEEIERIIEERLAQMGLFPEGKNPNKDPNE